MKRAIRVMIALVISVCLQTVSATTVTITQSVFDITFYNAGDMNGDLTGEQDWTPEQMADIAASMSAWSASIANTPGRQIQVHMFWSELDSYGTNVLGGSGSYRYTNGTQQWNLGEYVWKEGDNPGYTSLGFDTIIQYDVTAAGVSWNFGADAPGAGQIDFRSVITHEIGHSLGFDSTYDPAYDDWGWFTDDYGYGGITAWDENLVDSIGNKPQNGGYGEPDNFNQLDNPIYWDGANAVALYGGLVPIYAPASWDSGSSLTHLDEAVLGDLLMSPSIATGQMIREVSELEWAMMADMGWTIIPEPATLILLALGGCTLLKKRKNMI